MSKVVIIAEAGVNHNGSLEMACRLADEAKHAGADYVKFQTGIPENVISVRAEQAEYQKHNTGTSESQLDMVRKIMLRPDDFKPLKEYCDSIGIRFLSTPFDLDSIDILKPLEMDLWKIPSGEITNLPYLRKIASMGQPVVMSTGMSRLGEVDDAVGVLLDGGLTLDMITLLHCNTEYPTPYTDVNLRAMLTLRDAIGCRVGYSDHTLGIEVPVAAVAMGAEVIEKHFTLDKTLPGPDHVASLEPAELKAMVSAIRHTEAALGSGRKEVSRSERKNIAIARKSIIAARPISKGERFSHDNLTVKRPGNGISPMLWDTVVGLEAPRDFEPDELIELR
ncbi:N-acetylneuraminate synthase [Paramuribaculum intestinale]|jgi:N,N'-diacetyllegionaminate synthase|uniref:N-acetylneuraminate synthase n=1 Tax=Paramuribaculum intestinale TaxID=2094151 RepID=A0A2V1IVT1_9BACT|nr:N-acetylneuraminate synthase [Paramuribaculum intestinale]MBJ2186932.1 N-acetylneuraminate synthase [Muribaculaceae bacterium]ROS92630.1 N-acetylneuraminate synthase [Muribaculaceae bacterium Isolate-043 (Harlan)]ROT15392.1 N-acetylneuraminate synthase [Muribaculaceae bacterium Isolate-105 (HZI)]MCX4330177.1 N-acetylneuraminate synthase [Paramuribaculum intestinale]PWB07262.1 N-acetylneuraminate synthase [Paramuribaculum intestinale]